MCALIPVIAAVVHCKHGHVHSCTVPAINLAQHYIRDFCMNWCWHQRFSSPESLQQKQPTKQFSTNTHPHIAYNWAKPRSQAAFDSPTSAQVGDGVKGLAEGDWVVPAKVHMGTWRSAAVWKGADLLRLPEGCLPVHYAAVWRELCLAYRLLEDHASLKVTTSWDFLRVPWVRSMDDHSPCSHCKPTLQLRLQNQTCIQKS